MVHGVNEVTKISKKKNPSWKIFRLMDKKVLYYNKNLFILAAQWTNGRTVLI